VAKKAVDDWVSEQSSRAFNENYFASTMVPSPEVQADLCGYFKWWQKFNDTFDPNGCSPEAGPLF
jgi:hypothetical protein